MCTCAYENASIHWPAAPLPSRPRPLNLNLTTQTPTPHRHTLQHCGLRDTIAQLQGKAEPLRRARADDYSKGWKHANHIRSMAKALSEVCASVGRSDR